MEGVRSFGVRTEGNEVSARGFGSLLFEDTRYVSAILHSRPLPCIEMCGSMFAVIPLQSRKFSGY